MKLIEILILGVLAWLILKPRRISEVGSSVRNTMQAFRDGLNPPEKDITESEARAEQLLNTKKS